MFCFWLHSLNIILLSFIIVVAWINSLILLWSSILFYWCTTICVSIQQVNDIWVISSSSGAYKYSNIGPCVHMWINTQGRDCWVVWQVYKNLTNYYPKWLYHFAFLSTIYENLNFSTLSSTCCHLKKWFSYSNMVVVIFSCGFHLHLTNDFEHIFICILDIYIFSLVKCLKISSILLLGVSYWILGVPYIFNI